MKKKSINEKEFLRFIKKTKKFTGVVPTITTLCRKFCKVRKTINDFLYFLETEGKIVINKGKKGSNYYDLKI